MERNGVSVEVIRAIDHGIATGVQPDMTEHGWERDGWPEIFERVMAADILVLPSPIWLGEKSSVCTQAIERLYGNSPCSTPTTDEAPRRHSRRAHPQCVTDIAPAQATGLLDYHHRICVWNLRKRARRKERQ